MNNYLTSHSDTVSLFTKCKYHLAQGSKAERNRGLVSVPASLCVSFCLHSGCSLPWAVPPRRVGQTFPSSCLLPSPLPTEQRNEWVCEWRSPGLPELKYQSTQTPHSKEDPVRECGKAANRGAALKVSLRAQVWWVGLWWDVIMSEKIPLVINTYAKT